MVHMRDFGNENGQDDYGMIAAPATDRHEKEDENQALVSGGSRQQIAMSEEFKSETQSQQRLPEGDDADDNRVGQDSQK